MTKLRVGALISGGGTNLQAIIDACEAGAIGAEMAFVGTDNPGAKGMARAEKHGIPGFVADYGQALAQARQNPEAAAPQDLDIGAVIERQHLFAPGEDPERTRAWFMARAACEAGLLAEMDRFEWDLLVLAGFMRVLTPYFLDRASPDPAKPRVMNIHPALLPAFPGTDGYGDTLRYGCKVGGCTVHYVDYGEDSGPIIGQRCFSIEPADTLDTVKKKGLALEWQLYPECIALHAQGRLQVVESVHEGHGGRAVRRRTVEILPPALRPTAG